MEETCPHTGNWCAALRLGKKEATRQKGCFQGVLLSDAVQQLVKSKQASNRSKQYISGLRQYLNAFAAANPGLPISEVCCESVERWFASRNESPNSKRSNLGRLASLFTFAESKGWIRAGVNPLAAIEAPLADLSPPEILTPEQSHALVKYCAERVPRFVACLCLILYCCLRPSEARRIAAVDTQGWTVTVRLSKVRRFRVVPVPEIARPFLKEPKPISLSSYKRYFAKVQNGTGIRLGQDTLRHTCISYTLALNGDASKTATLGGNSVKIINSHYNGLATRRAAEAFFTPPPNQPDV